jgi:toxin-antitoxin system PIN domain toxin
MKTTWLPDVNVWLALGFRSHQHHAIASAWFSMLNDEASLCFCRMTQQGFLRLATHPQATTEPVTLMEAWRLYDRILEDGRIHFAIEPKGLDGEWRALTQTPLFSPKVWNDAYLAAFAIAGGYEVVTFDRGFEQFKLDRCTILS